MKPAIRPTSYFTLMQSGDLTEIQTAGLSLDDLDKTDHEERTLFSVAKGKQEQALLDYCYQLAQTYFTKGDAVDIKAYDRKGRSLLHWAAKCNQSHDTIQMLLNRGADINDANNPFKVTPLYMAAMDKSPNALQALIELGADIDAKVINGAIALHAAAENGCKQCVQLLLAAGANPKATCQNGYTPLIAAEKFQHTEIIKLLKTDN